MTFHRRSSDSPHRHAGNIDRAKKCNKQANMQIGQSGGGLPIGREATMDACITLNLAWLSGITLSAEFQSSQALINCGGVNIVLKGCFFLIFSGFKSTVNTYNNSIGFLYYVCCTMLLCIICSDMYIKGQLY